jgi:hypothetical protein
LDLDDLLHGGVLLELLCDDLFLGEVHDFPHGQLLQPLVVFLGVLLPTGLVLILLIALQLFMVIHQLLNATDGGASQSG